MTYCNWLLKFAAPTPVVSEVISASKGKQKKKPKKSGRTIEEEEDLDAILAELEGPSRAAAAPVTEAAEPVSVAPTTSATEVSVTMEPTPVAEATVPEVEEVTESAAAKKKKKKKEKEKAKTATGA